MAGGHEITYRVLYLQKYFEEHQGRYIKMEELQNHMAKEGYPNSIKTLYKDLAVIKETAEIIYDYREKAYIYPLPEKIETGIDVIKEAISRDCKISFKSFRLSSDRFNPRKYANKGEPIEASPYLTFKRNGKEYAYVYLNEKKGFRTYRIDRIDDIQILGRKREGRMEFFRDQERLNKNTETKVFNMYKGDKTANVIISFADNLAGQVVDEFGEKVIMFAQDDGHFRIIQPISISPTFYAWIATFGKSVKIEGPQDVIEGFKEFLHKSLDLCTIVQKAATIVRNLPSFFLAVFCIGNISYIRQFDSQKSSQA